MTFELSTLQKTQNKNAQPALTRGYLGEDESRESAWEDRNSGRFKLLMDDFVPVAALKYWVPFFFFDDHILYFPMFLS